MHKALCVLVLTCCLGLLGCPNPVGAGDGSGKAILTFSIESPEAIGVVDESHHTITVAVPVGTDRSALVAVFTTSGAVVRIGSAVQVSGETINDFTSPVTYSVIADDDSTEHYLVTVTNADPSEKQITSFNFTNPIATGTISQATHTITATLPGATYVHELVATFMTTGASVWVDETPQVSGTTSNDFTNPVTYTVRAVDGTTQDYVVTVAVGQRYARTVTWTTTPDLSTVEGFGGRQVDSSAGAGAFPSMVISGTNRYVAYGVQGGGLRFAKSTTSGVNWSTPLEVGSGGGDARKYLLEDSLGALYIIYRSASGVASRTSDDSGDTWGSEVILATGNVQDIRLSSAGSDVFLAFIDTTSSNVVKFIKSPDGGATWSGTPATIATESESITALGLGADSGRVYIFYRKWGSTNGTCRLYRSTDSGDDWDLGLSLSQLYYPFETSMMASGNTVSMAFSNDSGIIKSTDYGATWGSKVSFDYGFVREADLAQDSPNAYVAYCESNASAFKLARSTDDGASWTSQTVDHMGADGQSGGPALIASGTTLRLAYQSRARGLLFQESTDGGSTWLEVPFSIPVTGKLVDDSDSMLGEYSAAGVDGTTVYIAYSARGSSSGLKIARSTDSGATWQTGFIEPSGWAGLVSMTISSGNVYLAYSLSNKTMFAGSQDGGNTWTVQEVDAVSGNGDSLTSVAFDSGKIYIGYATYTSGGTSIVKLARSADGGLTWATATLDPAVTQSYGPTSVAAVGARIYVVYSDYGSHGMKFAYSSNSGSTWTLSLTAYQTANSYPLSVDGTGNVYVCNATQFLHSTDHGANWESNQIDTVSAPSTSMAKSGSQAAISYVDWTNRILRVAKTTDDGVNWTAVTVDTDGGTGFTSAARNGDVVYVAYHSSMGLGLKVNTSLDGGASFLW